MSFSNPFAALEIGTARTVVAVGEPAQGGRVRVVAKEKIASSGVRKSLVTQIPQSRFSIQTVLKALAENSSYDIHEAQAVISGPQILARQVEASVSVSSPAVTEDDLAEANDKTYEIALPSDREAVGVHLIGYGLDDIGGLANPRGMAGKLLTQKSLLIDGSANMMANTSTAAREAGLAVTGFAFAGLCASEAVLTPAQKREGAIVLDLGAGSTAYAVWADGAPVHAGVLGVGGATLTNDIARAFSITASQAESVKVNHASAVIDREDAKRRVNVPDPMPGAAQASISRRALNTVANARMHELFSIIASETENMSPLRAGVVLTGGGAALSHVAALAGTVFGCAARVGKLVPEIEGLEEEKHPEAYAAPAGLLLAMRQEEREEKRSFLDGILKSFGLGGRR